MSIKSTIMHTLFSVLTRKSEQGRLTILQFHKIPREPDPLVPGELLFKKFETILDFFAEQMHVLPLADALRAMQNGVLPRHAVALTLDDGYAEWVDFVAPALLQRNLPATFYVTTEQLNGPGLWHERIASAVTAAPSSGLTLPKGFVGYGDLTLTETRVRLLIQLQERFKYMPLNEREQAILALEAQAVTPLIRPKPFAAAQVRQLHNLGFEIGAHTIRHPILKTCSDFEARDEIGGAKETLESILGGGTVNSFAYPNGLVDRDFSQRDVELSKYCGYQSAVITGGGVANDQTNPFLLPRFTPWGPGRGRMALQIARNLQRSETRSIGQKIKHKPKIMFVECGAGFGGAIIALETLLKHSSPEQAEYEVVTNLPVGRFDTLASVRSLRVIGNRKIDTRRLVKKIEATHGLAGKRLWLFALGRLDDLFNRIPYLTLLFLHVLKRQPDVIHGNNEPSSNREAMLVAKLLNKPYVQHLRGPIAETAHTPWLLSKPDAFIPVSRWLAEELLVNGVPSGKIHQIYDAVDFEKTNSAEAPNLRDELKLPSDTVLVAMIGMLVPWKGQALFIDAVAKIKAEPKVTYLIIGGTPELSDNDFESQLRQAVVNLGLQEKILFTGKRSDLKQIMNQIDIVVSCSMEPEPLGLVMLESMANGCLFIGPAFGAATEVVDDGVNGLLFEPRSVESLAVKLIEANNSIAINNKLIKFNIKLMNKFNGENCAKATQDVHARLA